MCCFSRAVSFVGSTKIFARGLADGRQALVYAMNVTLSEELAMILPLPVPAGTADDAVTFINLQGEERFFDQLASAFPAFGPQAAFLSLPAARHAPAPKLVVFDVGQYEASFVPTAADFARLDERFRLPRGFFEALPVYADYGFAVFRLKPRAAGGNSAKPQSVQPMALAFPRREARALFFPTVHVHDGHVPSQAAFDHALYCQADGLLEATLGWTRSTGPLGQHVLGARSQNLIDGARGGFATSLWGENTNADLWLREPADITTADLHGAGACYAFEIRASEAHAFGSERAARPAWHETAAHDLQRLCSGVRQGLRELEASRQSAWRLAPLSDALRPHFMNGMQLWTGTSYMDGAPAKIRGPACIAFTPFSQRVAPQRIKLGFAELPTQDEAVAIHAELSRLLERAVSI
jgi:hypothetical protein